MGSTGAQGMADAVDDGLVGLRQAVSWNLTSNHYPPLPGWTINVALEAIELANNGDWEIEVTLPDYVEWINGRPTVATIVEVWHLDSFIDHDTLDW